MTFAKQKMTLFHHCYVGFQRLEPLSSSFNRLITIRENYVQIVTVCKFAPPLCIKLFKMWLKSESTSQICLKFCFQIIKLCVKDFSYLLHLDLKSNELSLCNNKIKNMLWKNVNFRHFFFRLLSNFDGTKLSNPLKYKKNV